MAYADTWWFRRTERQIKAMNTTLEELIMSTGDMQSAETQLTTDVQQLQSDHDAFKATVAAAMQRIQQEFDQVKGQVGDPTVLQGLDEQLQALHAAVTAETAQVSSYDPNSPSPTPDPAPTPPTPGA